MNSVTKIFALLTGVMMATTLVLPGRQTPAITDKLFGGLTKLTKAATGQN